MPVAMNQTTPKSRRPPRSKATVVHVFETDLRGRHRSRGGRLAVKNYGAKIGRASGLCGSSYAIPIYDYDGESPLSVLDIMGFIDQLIGYAESHTDLAFKIPALGKTIGLQAPISSRLLSSGLDNLYLTAVGR